MMPVSLLDDWELGVPVRATLSIPAHWALVWSVWYVSF